MPLENKPLVHWDKEEKSKHFPGNPSSLSLPAAQACLVAMHSLTLKFLDCAPLPSPTEAHAHSKISS